MAYEAKTQDDLAKWWVINTGSTVNRLSEIMDDCPLGPAIYYTTGWANTPPSLEYSRAVTTQPDSVDEKIGAGAWAALTPGVVGSLNAGEWGYAAGTLWVRLTGDVAPNATNQTRAHYLWDGSGAGPVIMTEVVEDGIYIINESVDIGDNSTSTTLSILNEVVYVADGKLLTCKQSATLNLGEFTDPWSSNGAYLSLSDAGADWDLMSHAGYLNVYGSHIHMRGTKLVGLKNGTVVIKNSIFSANYSVVGGTPTIWMSSTLASLSINKLFITNSYGGYVYKTPTLCAGLHVHDSKYGLVYNAPSPIVVTSPTFSDIVSELVLSQKTTGAADVDVVDSDTVLDGKITILYAATVVRQRYTVNIHISDKDGVNLSGASVACEDQYGAAAFTTQTTVADGTITEQTVTYKKWEGTSETLTTYSPHKFTISKSGYQTLVLDNITVSEAIDWHLELQPVPTSPSYNIGV